MFSCLFCCKNLLFLCYDYWYILYIIYAAITNFDIIMIEDLVILVISTKTLIQKMKIRNITFNIFTNIDPDNILVLLMSQFSLIF